MPLFGNRCYFVDLNRSLCQSKDFILQDTPFYAPYGACKIAETRNAILWVYESRHLIGLPKSSFLGSKAVILLIKRCHFAFLKMSFVGLKVLICSSEGVILWLYS